MFLQFVLVLICGVVYTPASCPNAKEIVDFPEASNVCAFLYRDYFCSGTRLTVLPGSANLWDNQQVTVNSETYHSSAQVRPGCTLRLYELPNFGGHGKKAKLTYRENGIRDLGDEQFNDLAQSYDCYCESWTMCQPKDQFLTIGRCEAAADLKNPVTCTYTYQTGTSITTTSSQGSSETTSIEATVGITLKSIFEASTTLSQEWNQWYETSNSEAFYKSETFEIVYVAEPGESIVIQQRVASCGDYSVKADFEVKTDNSKSNNNSNRARRLNQKIKVTKIK